MRHWQVALVDSPEEDAIVGFRFEVNPTAVESTLTIPSERRRLHAFRRIEKDPQTHHDLESIAYTEHKSIVLAEGFKRIRQKGLKLSGQNAASSNVVAVAKPTREAEYLKVGGQIGMIDQLIDVELDSLSTRHFKGESGLYIAIGARSSQNEHSRFRHPDYLSLIAVEARVLGFSLAEGR
jgi:hypothetical protein